LTPIKQFPLMFGLLAPVIAPVSQATWKIFGSGGYASRARSARDLAPIGSQVRFWGHHPT